jgi:putative transposase
VQQKTSPDLVSNGKTLDCIERVPRRVTTGSGGVVFHVLNRGVRRLALFDRPGDYRSFLRLVAQAQRRVPVRCLSYCLMPNHFHLVLWPRADEDLSRFMFWLTTTHSMRWHVWRGTAGTGHVYQGRFKAFPVHGDDHFLRVCRYVERNALRAGLVRRAEEWPWSSLAQRGGARLPVILGDWPVPRPADWVEAIQADPSRETHEIQHALRHSAPYGPTHWQESIAVQLGLTKSLRPMGRPRTYSPVEG